MGTTVKLGQIADRAGAGESETLEFKRTTGTRREAMRTVSAMLNQRGGQVFFGVTPDGDVVGQQVSERTVEELSAEIQRIEPPAFPTVERVPVAMDREVLVVLVGQGAARPYSYRGIAYRRVGNTTVTLSADEYNVMLCERIHGERRWENQVATGWTVNDLDGALIRSTVLEAVRRGRLEEPGSREPAELLRGLGLLREGVLWRAAAVLFGNSERMAFEMPQCLLRVARFRGTDRSEFLDNRQFHGNAFSLLANAERFLRETLPIAGRFEKDRFERIDEPLYPPPATREAIANALCHRDYSIGGGSVSLAVYDDRLEVISPGTLHFGLTPEKLFEPHESLPWNPLIARTFYRRGIIERWGRGTIKMAELSVAAGLPRPEIEDTGANVIVRFRHDRSGPHPPGPNEAAKRQETVLALLDRANEGLALREICARLTLHTSQRQVRRTLAALRERGLAVSTGHGVSARWKRRTARR